MGQDSAATGGRRPPQVPKPPGPHLDLQEAIWRSRSRFWSSERPHGDPNGDLDRQNTPWNVQITTWTSKRPPGAPNSHPELQMAAWSPKWPPGAANGRLEFHIKNKCTWLPSLEANKIHVEICVGGRGEACKFAAPCRGSQAWWNFVLLLHNKCMFQRNRLRRRPPIQNPSQMHQNSKTTQNTKIMAKLLPKACPGNTNIAKNNIKKHIGMRQGTYFRRQWWAPLLNLHNNYRGILQVLICFTIAATSSTQAPKGASGVFLWLPNSVSGPGPGGESSEFNLFLKRVPMLTFASKLHQRGFVPL